MTSPVPSFLANEIQLVFLQLDILLLSIIKFIESTCLYVQLFGDLVSIYLIKRENPFLFTSFG